MQIGEGGQSESWRGLAWPGGGEEQRTNGVTERGRAEYEVEDRWRIIKRGCNAKRREGKQR
jgi:hypothetical protein